MQVPTRNEHHKMGLSLIAQSNFMRKSVLIFITVHCENNATELVSIFCENGRYFLYR